MGQKMFKNTIIAFLFTLFCSNALALPKCPGEKRVSSTWINCNGSYKAIDGHTYVGDFDGKGRYTGYGILKNKGGIYEGQFLKNKFHGKGKQTIGANRSASISYYEGEFLMGTWNGKGKLWSEDGQFKYEGDFQKNDMTGYGTLTFRGLSVTGNWKNGGCNDQATCDSLKATEKKYQK